MLALLWRSAYNLPIFFQEWLRNTFFCSCLQGGYSQTLWARMHVLVDFHWYISLFGRCINVYFLNVWLGIVRAISCSSICLIIVFFICIDVWRLQNMVVSEGRVCVTSSPSCTSGVLNANAFFSQAMTGIRRHPHVSRCYLFTLTPSLIATAVGARAYPRP